MLCSVNWEKMVTGQLGAPPAPGLASPWGRLERVQVSHRWEEGEEQVQDMSETVPGLQMVEGAGSSPPASSLHLPAYGPQIQLFHHPSTCHKASA